MSICPAACVRSGALSASLFSGCFLISFAVSLGFFILAALTASASSAFAVCAVSTAACSAFSSFCADTGAVSASFFAGSGAVLRFSNSSSSLLYRSMSETISSLFIICLRWVKFAGRPFCGRAKTSHIQYIAAAPFWSHVRALTHIF